MHELLLDRRFSLEDFVERTLQSRVGADDPVLDDVREHALPQKARLHLPRTLRSHGLHGSPEVCPDTDGVFSSRLQRAVKIERRGVSKKRGADPSLLRPRKRVGG